MEIKENIQWLCKFLHLNGFSPLSPETFRKAKFNKDDDIFQLWILLYELVSWLQEQKVSCCKELENGKIIELKKKMKLLGYYSPSFLDLTLSSKCCSQELLLGIGWIIARYNLINMLAATSVTHSLINCEDTSCISKEYNIKKFNCAHQKVSEYANQIIWSLRHLKFSLNSLSAVQQRRVKYLHEIHKITEGRGLSHDYSHLSMLEGVVITNIDLQKKFIEQLEKETKILVSYIRWKEGEEIFWKWMESVVILRNNELNRTENGENTSFYNNTDQNKQLQNDLKNINFCDFTLQEPRLIFQNKHYKKSKNTLKKINKELEAFKDSCEKELSLKHKKYFLAFEELSSKFQDIICIPP